MRARLGRIVRKAFARDRFFRSRFGPYARRRSGGTIRRLSAEYFAWRDSKLHNVLRHVLESGEFDESYVSGSEWAVLDERVIEYPVALATIADARVRLGRRIRILDIGCVLNHSHSDPFFERYCEIPHFLNPSPEPIRVDQDAVFLCGDVREHSFPTDYQFDIVTCLSTLEHIGMDNVRYGGGPAEIDATDEHPERFAVDAIQAAARFVAPGGTLLASVPFGPFEYLYTTDRPTAPIYYVLDSSRARALAEALPDASLECWTADLSAGWRMQPRPASNIRRYAVANAGAPGVAFVRWNRAHG